MAFLGDVTLDSSTDTKLEKCVLLSEVDFVDMELNGDVTLPDSDDDLIQDDQRTSTPYQLYRRRQWQAASEFSSTCILISILVILTD